MYNQSNYIIFKLKGINMQSEPKGFFDTVVYVFFVFNSLGMIPAFVSLLARYDHKKQVRIIIRELLIALVVLLLFTFFGKKILGWLSISTSTIGIAGGILLFLIGLNLIFPKPEQPTQKDVPGKEPFIIPLAIPGLAGPGTMTALTIISAQTGPFIASGAFILAWIPSLFILLGASYIKKILGAKGLIAVEKLGGMILCFLGIQVLTDSIIGIVKLLK